MPSSPISWKMFGGILIINPARILWKMEKKFINKKDYFESIYLRLSKEKWLYREK